MTDLSPRIAARCAKIVGQLASDSDGVVVAAGRALISTLQAAGLGITDLSDHIVAQPREVVRFIHKPADPPRSGPRDYGDFRGSWREARHPSRRHKARMARLRAAPSGFLSTWEAAFLLSLGRHLDQGRSLSPKQEAVLDGIFERFEGCFG